MACGLAALLALRWGQAPPEHALPKKPSARWAVAALALMGLVALVARGGGGAIDGARAMRDRYLEHLLPAELIRAWGPDTVVAIHDLGALAYFTDARLLDLYGLGSREPVVARRDGGLTPEAAAAWLRERGAELALIKVEWRAMAELVPTDWIAVAEWRLPRNVVFGDHRLVFFAANPRTAARLRTQLEELAPTLPPELELELLPGR